MLAQGRILRNVLVANMDKQMEDISMERYQKKVCELEVEEVYIVLVCLVKRLLDTFIRPVGEKTLYYISSRFEKRKFLENNLNNLGIYELVDGVLASKGQNLTEVENVEQEYIGNQHFCGNESVAFFEVMSQMKLPGEAIGIRLIRRNEDRDKEAEGWEKEKSWLIKENTKFQLSFQGKIAQSVLYTMDVAGNNKELYKYRIFDLEVEDGISPEEKMIYYKYFLVSSAVKMILMQMREKKYDLRKLDQYAQIRFDDDDDLVLVIPEILRIFVKEKAIPEKEALEIVKKTFGYHNYETMMRDVGKCPQKYVDALIPDLLTMIEEVSKVTEN